jgi:hypothetical protein
MKNTKQNKESLIEQLRKKPVVEVACQKIGISRMTFYRWKKDKPEFAKSADEAILEGRSLVNDLAETQLIGAVKERNLQAITYWLRNHHPDYANKLEIKHAIQDENLTPEQEALVREALRLASSSLEKVEEKIAEQTNEPQKHNPDGTGGSDDPRPKGKGVDR